jgi:hypothetical protein
LTKSRFCLWWFTNWFTFLMVTKYLWNCPFEHIPGGWTIWKQDFLKEKFWLNSPTFEWKLTPSENKHQTKILLQLIFEKVTTVFHPNVLSYVYVKMLNNYLTYFSARQTYLPLELKQPEFNFIYLFKDWWKIIISFWTWLYANIYIRI